MADVDTVWNSLEIAKFAISAVTPIIIICTGYIINRKLDGLRATSELDKVWAKRFFNYFNKYSDIMNEYFTQQKSYELLQIYHGIDKNLKDTFKNRYLQKEQLLCDHVDNIKIHYQILSNYPFPDTKNEDIEAFQRSLTKLQSLWDSFVESRDVRKPNESLDTDKIIMETIEELKIFNKAAKKSHAVLLGIDKYAHTTKT